MKKLFTAALCLVLALLMLLPSCSSRGQTLIEAGKEDISVGVFALYLARKKYELKLAGDNVNDASYWKKIVNMDGQTMAEYWTDDAFQYLKYVAAGMILYQEMGLKLDPGIEKGIDDEIDALIESVGSGSKATFNSILSEYMVNVTMLKESWIILAKIEQLKEELYGENASDVLSNAKEEFYDAVYYRAKLLHIANFYYAHDKNKDDYNRSVYYLLNASGNIDTTKIAYDTVNGTPTGVMDANGNEIYRELGGIAYDTEKGEPNEQESRDDAGDLIYYLSNGKIAYDTAKGKLTEEKDANGDAIYRKWVIAYNEDPEVSALNYQYEEKDGQKSHKIAYYTTDEMAKREIAAKKIAADCAGKSEAYFDQVMEEYDDSRTYFAEVAPNGIYFAAGTTTTDTFFAACATELYALEQGELTVMDSDAGLFVMRRCDLDDGAWGKTENATWFSTFNTLVVESLFQKAVAEYLDDLVIHEDVLATIDITMVSPTNYY